MYGVLVIIDVHKLWVSCSPQTPRSEVLRRAMLQMKQKEAQP